MGWDRTALAIATLINITTAQAETLENQWFLGKWNCKLGDTRLQMTGLIADDAKIRCENQACTSKSDLKYQFHALVEGLALQMDVVTFDSGKIQVVDDSGSTISLAHFNTPQGTRLEGQVASGSTASQISCARPARYLKPKQVPHVQAGLSILPAWLFGD